MPGLLPPDERYRQRMITQLKTLEDLGGVTVKVSGRQRQTGRRQPIVRNGPRVWALTPPRGGGAACSLGEAPAAES
jgi:hypothetical protein